MKLMLSKDTARDKLFFNNMINLCNEQDDTLLMISNS